MAIWNLKNCQNFKLNENFKGVAKTSNFFPRVIFIEKTEYDLKIYKNFTI